MPAMITAAALLLLSATGSFSPLQCPGYILPVRPGPSNCPTTLDDVLTVLGGRDLLVSRIQEGATWLVNTSQIKTEALPVNVNISLGDKPEDYQCWKGAFRSEYMCNRGTFDMYEPVWHGGQASIALMIAAALPELEAVSSSLKSSAGMWVQWVLNNLETEKPVQGRVKATTGTSTVLEGLAALYAWDNHYKSSGQAGLPSGAAAAAAATTAARWYKTNAWQKGNGTLLDNWNISAQRWAPPGAQLNDAIDGTPGRPLADDSVFLQAYHQSGDPEFKTLFFEILDTLIKKESPPGNWNRWAPSDPYNGGQNHPRQAFWWGRPFVQAYHATGDMKYLAVANRSAYWYATALRNDGGMTRYTSNDYRGASYHTCTSASSTGAILMLEVYNITRDEQLLWPILSTLRFAAGSQFRSPTIHDPNLKGAVLETSSPDSFGTFGWNYPGGELSDACPYFLRDISTSFFVHAAALLLNLA